MKKVKYHPWVCKFSDVFHIRPTFLGQEIFLLLFSVVWYFVAVTFLTCVTFPINYFLFLFFDSSENPIFRSIVFWGLTFLILFLYALFFYFGYKVWVFSKAPRFIFLVKVSNVFVFFVISLLIALVTGLSYR